MNEFEIKIIEAIQRTGSDFWDGFWRVITAFAELGAILTVVLALFIFLSPKKAFRFGFIIAATAAVGVAIKYIIARYRPYIFDPLIDAKDAVWGFSFPSGHTLAAVIIALTLISLFPKKKKITIPIAVIFSLLVGFSRVYLGVHYPSDVLGALIIGTGLYFVLAFTFDRIYPLVMYGRIATRLRAWDFAHTLKKYPQAIILYDAPMGAGKTTFTKSVIKHLSSHASAAASPTFTIINQYANNIYHIDLYRIEDERELSNTAFYEIVDGQNYVFIEWAENSTHNFTGRVFRVKIEIMGAKQRRITICHQSC